jgi:uncharacterized membrane protein
MRRLAGLALVVLGLLCVVLGVALAVLFGPDNRMGTGPHRLSTPGQAIVTSPGALAYSGPQVEIRVNSVQPGRNLFAGVAHDVDVRDFLGSTPRTRIDTIEIPWRVSTTRLPGRGFPKGDASEQTWWIADAKGQGEVVLDWRLPDTAADVVILDDDGGRGLAVDVTAAVVAPGAFVVGVALVVLGLGVVVFGWAVLTTPSTSRRGTHALRATPEGGPA